MENASKALLIAAAVLIVIIIIAVGMKIYSSTTDAQKEGINTGKTISEKTGDATDLAISEITGKRVNKNIKYYEGKTEEQKEQDKVKQGDTIRIGSERFMVFLIDDEGIKAMPYYNLKLDSKPIKQATIEDNYLTTGSYSFSKSIYWTAGTDKIDMSDSENLIQSYITAYKTTLEGMGADGIIVRAGKYSELNASGVTTIMRNPGEILGYWLGSANPNENYIWIVSVGSISSLYY